MCSTAHEGDKNKLIFCISLLIFKLPTHSKSNRIICCIHCLTKIKNLAQIRLTLIQVHWPLNLRPLNVFNYSKQFDDHLMCEKCCSFSQNHPLLVWVRFWSVLLTSADFILLPEQMKQSLIILPPEACFNNVLKDSFFFIYI